MMPAPMIKMCTLGSFILSSSIALGGDVTLLDWSLSGTLSLPILSVAFKPSLLACHVLSLSGRWN